MEALFMDITADINMIMICYIVLFLAFIANVVLSLYYNISMSKEAFEIKRLWDGIKKAIVLIIGTLLMVAAADTAAWITGYAVNIDEETHELITAAMIAATIGVAAWRYIKDAYRTFINILNSDTDKIIQDKGK